MRHRRTREIPGRPLPKIYSYLQGTSLVVGFVLFLFAQTRNPLNFELRKVGCLLIAAFLLMENIKA